MKSVEVYSPFVMLELIGRAIMMAIVILYFDRVKNTDLYYSFYQNETNIDEIISANASH